MRLAGELVSSRRLPEAETEIAQALAHAPHDLRALKLLALVRFKLGRLAEARETYQTVVRAAPDDPGVRRSLGLVALKLEWFHEAVGELEAAARLEPGDRRVWSYLGYAYARVGRSTDAADAFRRAGQPDLAAEMDRGTAVVPPPDRRPGEGTEIGAVPSGLSDRSSFSDEVPTAVERADLPVRLPAPVSTGVSRGQAATLTGFTIPRLVTSEERDGALEWVSDGVLRFGVRDEAHVRNAEVLASGGRLLREPARRREQGRFTDAPLGVGAGAFCRCTGRGDLWLSASGARAQLTALLLEDDVLYVREDRVVAFDGDVVWESGAVAGEGLALVQFRGSGRVVLDFGGDDVLALRLTEDRPVNVNLARLVGWIGRVIVQGGAGRVQGNGAFSITPSSGSCACEGEGVLLLWKHG